MEWERERQCSMCLCTYKSNRRLPPFTIWNSNSFTAIPMPFLYSITENSLVTNWTQREGFFYLQSHALCTIFFSWLWTVFHLVCYLVVICSPATPTDIPNKIVVARCFIAINSLCVCVRIVCMVVEAMPELVTQKIHHKMKRKIEHTQRKRKKKYTQSRIKKEHEIKKCILYPVRWCS